MRKRIFFSAFVVALVMLIGAGCKLPLFSELAGTWEASEGGVTETITFGPFNFKWVISGAVTGELKCSIDEVNEDLGHLQMTVTSSEGVWSSIPPDSVIYVYYEIIGDSLYFALSYTSYPTVVDWGPYTK